MPIRLISFLDFSLGKLLLLGRSSPQIFPNHGSKRADNCDSPADSPPYKKTQVSSFFFSKKIRWNSSPYDARQSYPLVTVTYYAMRCCVRLFSKQFFTVEDKIVSAVRNLPISLFQYRQHRLTGTVGATVKVTSLSTRLATNMATFRRLLFESLESDFRNLEMLDQAMEIHENFIPHESQCSTEAVPFYYNLGMSWRSGTLVCILNSGFQPYR